MKASIRTAKEPDLLERGPRNKPRTARISRGPITKIKPVSNGREVVSLELTATRYRNPGTGDRGGAFKAFADTLKLQLEPRDLKEILTAAMENGLISVHFKPKGNQ